MANSSAIEWTDATWNPIAGCTPVSPGCTHCYAATMARRLEAMGQAKYRGTAERRGSVDVFTGRINLDEAALEIPLRWKKPKRIFVNSMSDLFHEDVPDAFIDRVFAVIALCDQHTFQVLTKRPTRMAEYLIGLSKSLARLRDACPTGWCLEWNGIPLFGYPLLNVWLGVSVEDQQRADERIPHLVRCPAAIRFLSCEPLLGPLDLARWLSTEDETNPFGDEGRRGEYPGPEIDWVIAGGESGRGARPSHPEWVRLLRNQCQAAGVPFFFKQWGEWRPGEVDENIYGAAAGNMSKVGKKYAGRLLDGREWNEFPVAEVSTKR